MHAHPYGYTEPVRGRPCPPASPGHPQSCSGERRGRSASGAGWSYAGIIIIIINYTPPFANGSREPGRPCRPGAGGSPPGGAGRCSAPTRGTRKVEGREPRWRRGGETGLSPERARPGWAAAPGGPAVFRETHGVVGGAHPGRCLFRARLYPPFAAAPRSLPRRSVPLPGPRPPRAAGIRFPRGAKLVPLPAVSGDQSPSCFGGTIPVIPRFGPVAGPRGRCRRARLTVFHRIRGEE